MTSPTTAAAQTGERKLAAATKREPFAESVSILLGELDEPVVWLVEHLFAACAHGWIGAEPKVGKSWLALWLAICAALGIPFLGYEVPRAVRVLYVQEEDSRRRVRRRLRQLLRGHAYDPDAPPPELNANLHVAIRKGFKIDHELSRAWLAHEMATFKPDIIIVDVFNEVHGAKEKDQDGISPVLRHFTELERKYGGAFIILHHFYKGDARTPRARGGQSLRGSSALHGWAENSLYLFYGKKNRFRVEPESKDESDAVQFEVEITDTPDGGVQLVRHEIAAREPADTEEFSNVTRAMLLAEDGEITAMQAGMAMGCTKKTAHTRLVKWEAQARVVRRHVASGGPNGTDFFSLPSPAKPSGDKATTEKTSE